MVKDKGDIDFQVSPTAIGKDFKKVFIARVADLRFVGRKGVTKEELIKIKENFENGVIGREVDFDYSHKEDSAKGHKAAGWLKELVFEDMEIEGEKFESLWGIPKWTPPAEQELANEEWKYISPTINFNWRHPESGKVFGPVLKSVSLLNNPQFLNQPNVELSDKGANPDNITEEVKMNKLQAFLEAQDVNFSGEATEDIILMKFKEVLSKKDSTILQLETDKTNIEEKFKVEEVKAKKAESDLVKFREVEQDAKIKTLCDMAVGLTDGKLKVEPTKADFKEKKGMFFNMFSEAVIADVKNGNDERFEQMKEYIAGLPVVKEVAKSSSTSETEEESDEKSFSEKLNERIEKHMEENKDVSYQDALVKVSAQMNEEKQKKKDGGDK